MACDRERAAERLDGGSRAVAAAKDGGTARARRLAEASEGRVAGLRRCVYLDGLRHRLASRFGFSEGAIVFLETVEDGFFVTAAAFLVRRRGWVWDEFTDDVRRAPEYDDGCD